MHPSTLTGIAFALVMVILLNACTQDIGCITDTDCNCVDCLD